MQGQTVTAGESLRVHRTSRKGKIAAAWSTGSFAGDEEHQSVVNRSQPVTRYTV